MNTKCAVLTAVAVLISTASIVHGQDPKSGAEDIKYSRDVYSKVHMVVIAKLEFEAPPAAEFQYDRYPNGGAERIKSGDGKEYARKDGKTWLESSDWGDTGQPADAETVRRLNNWVSVIDTLLKSEAPLKFVTTKDDGARDEFVFEESGKGKRKAPQWSFGKYKTATNDKPPILDHFTGPMQLGMHDAKVDIKFSYLIAIKMNVVEASPSPGASGASATPTASPAPGQSPSVGNANPKPSAKADSQSQSNGPGAELVDRGIEKGKKGDLNGAIADFDKAIKANPNNANHYINRAYARRLKKDPAGAIADYTRAIEIDPKSADAYYNRGNVKAIDNKDVDGAIADYTLAIEADPKYSHAYYNRAVAKKQRGDAAGADADFKRAAEIDPELAPPTVNTITLLDGKFGIDVPSDFERVPDDPKEPKTLAKFAHNGEGGAWGTVLRGTHGLKPEELKAYLDKRVAEYTKGFKWMPKDAHLQWLHKEIVTINGWKWADWSFVPTLKGKQDYRNNPVYTRNLTTSYKGQLLEVNFTTNLTTDPALKDEIDKIIASMHLEE